MTLDLFNTNQEHTDEISLDITDAKISVWPGMVTLTKLTDTRVLRWIPYPGYRLYWK